MPGIFINYRRDDAAGFARSLYEHLDQEFKQGQVFMDVEALREPGMDFAKEIDRSLGRCAAMLVLIGKSWISSKDEAGRRRIDEPEDFVRLEIATALKRDVRVIPVLLGGAAMPRADELPEDLQAIGRRQAISLTHDDWSHDVSRLVEALAKVPGIRKRSKRGQTGWSTRSMIIAGAAGGALVLGGLAWTGAQFFEGNKSHGASSEVDKPSDNAASDAGAATRYGATPAPEPEQASSPPEPRVYAASKVPVVSDEVVHRAQILLAALGYDPGVVDGVNGAATAAAVRAFQYDEGFAETGTIDDALIAQLQSATQNRPQRSAGTTSDVVEQPASYADTGADAEYQQLQSALAELSSNADLSGTWYDNNGVPAMIMQSGSAITVAAINPATGLPQVIGSGTVDGRVVTIDYRNFFGVPGTVHAELAPDGTHLNGTDENAALQIAVPNTWHREHLPGE
jgi:peptidoglycan hydrolase-like protein with peptidoglycan-binding domain